MNANAKRNDLTSQSNPSGCDVLVSTSIYVIEQLEAGLNSLTGQQYTHSDNENTSSIGKHVRHIVEFYQALFNAAQTPSAIELCYDNRQRDIILEESRETVLQKLTEIKEALNSLSERDVDVNLTSIVDIHGPMIYMRTTLHRELFYVLDHTIHHMALIKMLAQRQGASFDKNFGIAQSTQAHETAARS